LVLLLVGKLRLTAQYATGYAVGGEGGAEALYADGSPRAAVHDAALMDVALYECLNASYER
jgi:hypothetical protein